MKFLKILFLLICVFASVNVYAQSSDDLRKQRDRINNELDQLNHELQETKSNKKTNLKQLNILKAQISLREEKITVINKEVKSLDDQISDNTNTVHSLQSELDQLKKEYEAMVLFAYRNKSAYNKLMFIFASKDFNQAYKRLKYLQQFASYRERQANHIQATQKDLNVKIVELDKTKDEKHSLLLDQEKEKATLGKQKSSQQSVVNNLTKQEKQLVNQQQAKQREIVRINQAIVRAKIAELKRKQEEEERLANTRAAASGNKPASAIKPVARRTDSEILNATPEAAKLSNDFLGNKGRLPWPVSRGEITQGFGTYYIKGIEIDNTGVDIRTANGGPVRAIFDGQVSGSSNVSGTYTVIIRHGEYFTTYSNLRTVDVSRDQKVSTKQTIGTAAIDVTTGEPQVHFELWKVTTPVDPKNWLASGGS